MPTVLRHPKGWRVVIYTNDHRPPHVHVLGVEEHARFDLLCDLSRVKLNSSHGFSKAQLKSIDIFLNQNIGALCSAWGEVHGH